MPYVSLVCLTVFHIWAKSWEPAGGLLCILGGGSSAPLTNDLLLARQQKILSSNCDWSTLGSCEGRFEDASVMITLKEGDAHVNDIFLCQVPRLCFVLSESSLSLMSV